jgi:adenosylmethionine---8-amino-7-oxononanoate aminotransferase
LKTSRLTLAERDQASVWHPYTQSEGSENPIAIVSGKGSYLFDENGNRYIDGISSWWVNIHGHSHPYIAEKVFEQIKKLEHVIFAGFTHEKAVELAEALLMKLPENQAKIFYSDNGSTAVEVALKMSIQYWRNKGIKKNRIIALKDAYHGDTFGAMAVSGRSTFTESFKEHLFEVEFIGINSGITGLKSQISHLKSETAAFIFEPLIQGTAGMQMYDPKLLNELISFCKENQILTIADEVMTGFGRTGKMFAIDHVDVSPDIICLSKGLTGGTMALGVTSCSKEIFEAFKSEDKTKTFYHGHSYTGNPIACAAALASLELFAKEDTFKSITRISSKHSEFLNNIKTKFPQHIIRQTGTILAIEINSGTETSYFNFIRDKAYRYFLSKGILMRPLGNIVYLMPPYCISNEDLDYIYACITDFLNEL